MGGGNRGRQKNRQFVQERESDHAKNKSFPQEKAYLRLIRHDKRLCIRSRSRTEDKQTPLLRNGRKLCEAAVIHRNQDSVYNISWKTAKGAIQKPSSKTCRMSFCSYFFIRTFVRFAAAAEEKK